MIESIEARDDGRFNSVLAKYMNLTPFDKVKTQLIVKIKEIYMPAEATNASVARNADQLDFTGGSDTQASSTGQTQASSKQ